MNASSAFLLALVAGLAGVIFSSSLLSLLAKMLCGNDLKRFNRQPLETKRKGALYNPIANIWISFSSGDNFIWLNREQEEHIITLARNEKCQEGGVVATAAPVAYFVVHKDEDTYSVHLVRLCLPDKRQTLREVRTEDVNLVQAPGRLILVESVSADGERLLVTLMLDAPDNALTGGWVTHRFHVNRGVFEPIEP